MQYSSNYNKNILKTKNNNNAMNDISYSNTLPSNNIFIYNIKINILPVRIRSNTSFTPSIMLQAIEDNLNNQVMNSTILYTLINNRNIYSKVQVVVKIIQINQKLVYKYIVTFNNYYSLEGICF